MPDDRKPPRSLAGWPGFEAFKALPSRRAKRPEEVPPELDLSGWSPIQGPFRSSRQGPTLLPAPPAIMEVPKRKKFEPQDFVRYELRTLWRGLSDAVGLARQHLGWSVLYVIALLLAGAESGIVIYGREVPDYLGAGVVAIFGLGLIFALYIILAPARGHFDQKHQLDVRDALLLRHAQGVFKSHEDDPALPPFLTGGGVEYHRNWVPLLKMYHFAVKNPPRVVIHLRALCDRVLDDCSIKVIAEPTPGSDTVYLPTAKRGASSFTFTLEGAVAQTGCRLRIALQDALPPRILEIEEA